LLPTDTENVSTDMIGTPNSFSSIPELMGARNTSVSLAQGRTENSFGLAIPYANNIANVLDRSGDPTDGADNLNAVLALLNPEVETIGNGYSQGGAAVLSAVARPKGGRALDQAIALAPMGGCNRQGGKGLWAGKVGETSVVCATHSKDPAADITPGGGNWEMAKKAYSFEERPLDRALHSDTCEWQGQKSGLCDAAPDTQGTHGYPEPLVEQAVQLSETSDERNPQAYQRIQDWEWDQRELTHTPDLGLGPKPGT